MLINRNYEIWKDIEEDPGYQISNMGRIRSFKREKMIIIKLGTNQKGYQFINLFKNSKYHNERIHSLVIQYFGPPKPSPEHECNHKDGDKSNNWWTNLEWLTHKQNVNHAVKMGLWGSSKGENCNLSKLTEKQVIKIRKLHQSGNYTNIEISLAFKISQTCFYGIINKKTWKHI